MARASRGRLLNVNSLSADCLPVHTHGDVQKFSCLYKSEIEMTLVSPRWPFPFVRLDIAIRVVAPTNSYPPHGHVRVMDLARDGVTNNKQVNGDFKPCETAPLDTVVDVRYQPTSRVHREARLGAHAYNCSRSICVTSDLAIGNRQSDWPEALSSANAFAEVHEEPTILTL